MSNRLEIIRTRFTDVKSGQTSYGYRIYDDYGNGYNNMCDQHEIEDDGDLLRHAHDNCRENNIKDAIDLQIAMNGSVFIDDEEHDAEWMKYQLDKK